MQVYHLVIDSTDQGRRLDAALADLREIGLSRSRIQALLADGLITVNGGTAKPSLRLSGGEEVVVTVPPPETWDVEPEQIPLDIVYEDDSLIVVNKRRGLVVHPAVGHRRGTLVNALLAHCPDLAGVGGVIRPGLVHRLDKDTSGLIVVAKTDQAMKALSGQLKQRTVLKEYVAIAVGNLPSDGTVDAAVGRHPQDRKKMCVTDRGRTAVTHFRVEQRFGPYCFVRVRLETGRTHQIRVHLAHIGAPIAGDPVYGGRAAVKLFGGGQALHAAQIGFDHPEMGQWVEFMAPVPADMIELWNRLSDHA